MGALCCCFPQKTSYRMNEDNQNQNVSYQATDNDNVKEEEKRKRALEAAERRLNEQKMRGVTNPGGPTNTRQAHAELPGNANSGLRWQVS